MVRPAHNFRSHIARRSRSITAVLWFPYASNSEICQSKVTCSTLLTTYRTFFLENQVLGFDIPVDDAIHVQVLQCHEHASHEKLYIPLIITGLLLIKLGVPNEVVPEISTIDQIHNQVEILPILKCEHDVNKKRMVEALQQLPLVQHGSHTFLGEDSECAAEVPCLGYLFEGVLFLGFFVFNFPYLG